MSSSNGYRSMPSVAVVGAGFGGIGIGARLKQAGNHDFTIFERGESVGGVWRANTYPGAACDVPSHIYSFSFRRGHSWTRRYAPQPEILAYLEECADEFGLRPHLRLSTGVERAEFDADEGRWHLTLAGGEEHVADILVTACGQLSEPAIPALPGLDEFEGHSFHSAEWDHDHDLTGRRVAVIGTGASTIQFAPRIAPRVEQLDIYQRSAPWIIPKMDREYPAWERELFRRVPPRVFLSRAGLFAWLEISTYGFTGVDRIMRVYGIWADRAREKALSDPALRAAATPDYSMGCKRVLFTSEWYPMLERDDVELVSGGVERVTASGVVGPDGVERPADTIIFGTGFRSKDFVAPMEIRGLDGVNLEESWGDEPQAFLGTVVTGFPNMFLLYGPNTNHGSGSVPYTLECQFNYVLDALERMRDNGLRYLDLKPEVQAEWTAEMRTRSARTVWQSGGCTSWYVNADGLNTNNWPGAWLEYRRRTKRLRPGHFRAAPAVARRATAVSSAD